MLPPGLTGLLKQWPLLLAVLLLAAATRWPPMMVTQPTQRFLVAFDITQSMGVADMPDLAAGGDAKMTRLAYAKASARELLRSLPCGSSVAWAAFTDYRTIPLIEPLEVCAHFDALQSSLDALDARMRWANGSSVARGLYWAQRVQQAMNDPSTIVVFFSDGHEAPPAPAGGDAGALTFDKPIPGLVVGVGQDIASPIPRLDPSGRILSYWNADDVVQRTDVPPGTSHEELSALAEGHLRALAQRYAMGYLRLSSASALRSALLDVGHATLREAPKDVRFVPATLALLLLVGMTLWPWLRAPKARRSSV
jgi:mxaL protein